MTLLTTDAALESRLTSRELQAIAITILCHSLASHHACTPGHMLFPPVIGGLKLTNVVIFIIEIHGLANEYVAFRSERYPYDIRRTRLPVSSRTLSCRRHAN